MGQKSTEWYTYSKNPHRDGGQYRASELSGGQTESLLGGCTDTEDEEVEKEKEVEDAEERGKKNQGRVQEEEV